ncbi:hypothetical protein LN042_19100 [Kitasatospora sp. RB6PN24]|uniref:hypothetical protein n=1 Tax=Kitasatospora humi TaxID=2893891 RepID=UPI001E2A0D97|nr:hypothetical protein [Kitasatospora humi]MCC9309165.1 hypothetical protein [Kitasatospora humi]
MVDTVSLVVGSVADAHRVRADLLLAGLRLRIAAPSPRLVESVVGVLAPACEVDPSTQGEPGWTLIVDQAESVVEVEALFEGLLVLALPYSGRQLAVLDTAEGVLRLAARYRRGAAPVLLEVDAAHRATRLVVSPGDGVGVRWADWLARVFFASRLLAAGWRMLHASAVAVDGAALVFLAGQRGGKSTLAHRAVRERGALFLADDLVLAGPGGLVVGWPTRVAVPAELFAGQLPAVGRAERTVVAGVPRRRVLFSPPEHRQALSVPYSPPVPLGAVVVARSAEASEQGVRADSLPEAGVREAVAAAARVPQQLLYVSDALGLMGGPRLAEQAAGVGNRAELLGGVPAAALNVPADRLATADVWRALAPVVPLVGYP